MKANTKKFGFTLAEVLVTLSVISVVCVLTIPTLYQKYQEQITVSKVRKFYATLDMAYNLALKTKGPSKYWEVSTYSQEGAQKAYETLIKPHFKVAQDCGTDNKLKCLTEKNINKLIILIIMLLEQWNSITRSYS